MAITTHSIVLTTSVLRVIPLNQRTESVWARPSETVGKSFQKFETLLVRYMWDNLP